MQYYLRIKYTKFQAIPVCTTSVRVQPTLHSNRITDYGKHTRAILYCPYHTLSINPLTPFHYILSYISMYTVTHPHSHSHAPSYSQPPSHPPSHTPSHSPFQYRNHSRLLPRLPWSRPIKRPSLLVRL